MSRLHAVVCRVIPAAVGAAAVSCAQLAGIQDTNDKNRPGDSLAVTRMSVGNKVVLAPLDPTGLSATYFVASSDPSGFDRVPAAPDPSHGGWTTTKVHTPAPVEFTLPDVPTPIPRLFTFPSPQLSVLYGVLEHPNRQPMPTGSTFTVKLPLDAPVVAGQSFQVYVVGAWLQRGFSATEAPVVGATELAPPDFGFTAANSVSGRPQIDQITADDAFLILRYTGAILTGVAEAVPFTQTDTANTVMTQTTMTSVAPGPQSPAFSAPIAPSALAGRYMAVQPAAPAPLQVQINWSLVAAPGYTIASNAGPVLQSGAVAMTDTGVSVTYENPFVMRGWNTIFTLATAVNRVYMAPLGPMGGALPVNLQAGMNQFLEPPQGASTPVSLDLPAGLPQAITLGTVLLTIDGLSIKTQSQFVHVSFTVDAPASAAGQSPTLYNLQLFDLVFNPTTMAVDRVIVFAAASKDPAFALPPELFQAGHSYTLRALSTLGGYPTIDQGDFLHRQLPLAQSYLDSGVFTVMP
jgi:hypothetical protein